MSGTTDNDLQARLARLSPQQRALLERKLGQSGDKSAGKSGQSGANNGAKIGSKTAAATLAQTIEQHGAAPHGQPFAQSAAQQRIWFFERMQPDAAAYNMGIHHHLYGPLDTAALQAAFNDIIARHSALRTVFAEQDGKPVQTVLARAELTLEIIDHSATPSAGREALARQLASAADDTPFDLGQAPLLRASVVRFDSEHHLLLVVLHHMIADGWSLGVLCHELAAHYHARLTASPVTLPPLALHYADLLHWQAMPDQRQRLVAQTAAWANVLQGAASTLDLPIDLPRPKDITMRGAHHAFDLPAALPGALAALAKSEGCTLFVLLLAAFQTLLARHCGQDDILLGTPFANREEPEFTPLIGMFVNTLALRGDISGDPTFRQLLQRTRSHFLSALHHAEVPLERLVDALKPERVPGRSPLLQAMFVMTLDDGSRLCLDHLRAQSITSAINTARFEITLSLTSSPSGLRGVFDYNRDLFLPASMARMAEQLTTLLQGMVADPDCPISRLPLLPPAQVAALLTLGTGDASPAPLEDCPHGCLQELLLRQAQRTPDAIAVSDGVLHLSYRALAEQVNGVAGQLRKLGAKPETRVALLADRSPASIVGLLGILAAGAAYVPLDPGHPDARLQFMLQDAACIALFAPQPLIERANALAALCPNLPVVPEGSAAPCATPPAMLSQSSDAAWIIYTSGSTGTPKGVLIEHRHAMNLVQGFLARHDFAAQRLLMIPPLVFDASAGDLFPAIASGATLLLHPAPNQLGARELQQFCQQQQVSAIDAPAALWQRWSEGLASLRADGDLSEVLPGVRLIMFGGEAVPLEQVRRFAALTGRRITLANHYGPTEAAVCAAMYNTIDAAELNGSELPIGSALPGVRLYVLDANLQLVPHGVVGELSIGGAGVAREYVNAAAQTAERFLADPFVVGERIYRTGDLARWNPDGTLHFIGRRDHQVKLRGFRIELGEVEAALAACPGVRAAVAGVSEIRPGDKRLVAWYVADPEVGGETLRSALAAHLPEAMIPALFQRLDALPLTGNGKTDRRALPAPSASALQQVAERSLLAPTSATEQKLLSIWRELLARHDISTDDDFFSIGGDSLMTLPLVHQLRQAFALDVPLSTVFAAPSIGQLARAIDNLQVGIAMEGIDLVACAQLPPEIDPAHCGGAATVRAEPGAILITGATGFLGAYLVRELLDHTRAKLLCLVRAKTPADGLARIKANLATYGLWHSDDTDDTAAAAATADAADAARIVPLLGDLASPELGLGSAGFAALAEQADLIFHNGGLVNFLAPYQTMEAANVAGTREVLRLACTDHVKPVHFVSTLGVYFNRDYLDQVVSENLPPPGHAAQDGGYNQSKWVAEQLVLAARARGLPASIHRPARITGDSRTGHANLGDYFNSWLKGCVQLGLAPIIPGDSFDMAPVDYVAKSMVKLALGAGPQDGNYHYYNPVRLPLDQALAAMQQSGLALRSVPYPEWRTALQAEAARSRENALSTFASLFPEQPDLREPGFDCSYTGAFLAPHGLVCPPADRTLFQTYLDFMLQQSFFPTPSPQQEQA
jgi:amino acid adenylation domain-containing protein/thioester reductase-like protein